MIMVIQKPHGMCSRSRSRRLVSETTGSHGLRLRIRFDTGSHMQSQLSSSSFAPTQSLEIHLEDAISYTGMARSAETSLCTLGTQRKFKGSGTMRVLLPTREAARRALAEPRGHRGRRRRRGQQGRRAERLLRAGMLQRGLGPVAHEIVRKHEVVAHVI